VINQKLKKVGPRERVAIALSTSTNRRAMQDYERALRRRKGPAACLWCGQEPCGVLWTRPGDTEPGGERCCDRCSHEPVEGWQHTHTAWAGGQSFSVCALRMREGEVVYLRRDGVVQFLELRAPKPASALGEDEETDVPVVAFLGTEPDGASLHLAGDGGNATTSLWNNRRELDPVWLPLRIQAAVARDEERKSRRHAERLAKEAEHDARINLLIAEEEAARQKSIEKRALQHETRIVMDEVEVDEFDTAEEALEMPVASSTPGSVPGDRERVVRHIRGEGTGGGRTLCGREARDVATFEGVEAAAAAEALDCCRHCGRCARPELYSPPEEPPRRLTADELKRPARPKATGGRLQRSARQRRSRERQKRAWARQEAKNRLEVKRLERLARNQPANLVKDEGGDGSR
jgi:hypothetical protein